MLIMCDKHFIHFCFYISLFQPFIMVDVRQPDEIIATAGDIIAFERRISLIFDWLKIFTYFHFAVCTVTSEADPQVNVEQNEDR